MLAGLAAADRAQTAHERGADAEALVAVRAAVGHVEVVRAAVAGGGARTAIAGIVRDHYEQALLLAAALGDAPLELELRKQRLAGLLRRTGDVLPADVTALLTELDEVNAALLAGEPGLPPVGTARAVRALAAGDAAELRARRARLHERLVARTTAAFAATFGAEPLRRDEMPALDDDVLALVPLGDGERDVVVAVPRASRRWWSRRSTPVSQTCATCSPRSASGGQAAAVADLLPVLAVLPPRFLARLSTADEPVRRAGHGRPAGRTWRSRPAGGARLCGPSVASTTSSRRVPIRGRRWRRCCARPGCATRSCVSGRCTSGRRSCS